jgi:hypothetical protein
MGKGKAMTEYKSSKKNMNFGLVAQKTLEKKTKTEIPNLTN